MIGGMHRFYVENLGNPIVLLGDKEIYHLGKVLRIKGGEKIVLFDGSGAEAIGEVLEKGRAISVRILERHTVDRELSVFVTIAAACPKGERLEWMVAKLVELGCSAFIPCKCERSVAGVTVNKKLRLERIVIEASKQSGRTRLMEISDETSLATMYTRLAEFDHVFISSPEADSYLNNSVKRQSIEGKKVLVLVGPEGGFTGVETEQAINSGALQVKLSKTILRIETAAIAAMTIFAQNPS